MHSVVFDDTDENWKLWGELVDKWVDLPANQRPRNIGELEYEMTHAGATGTDSITGIKLVGHPVPNPDPNWPVNVPNYQRDDRRPLVIGVPTRDMINADRNTLIGNTTYPLPSFYTTIFGSAPTAIFSKAELDDMARRRLGEYVINECM